jgi:hypothetical protein
LQHQRKKTLGRKYWGREGRGSSMGEGVGKGEIGARGGRGTTKQPLGLEERRGMGASWLDGWREGGNWCRGDVNNSPNPPSSFWPIPVRCPTGEPLFAFQFGWGMFSTSTHPHRTNPSLLSLPHFFKHPIQPKRKYVIIFYIWPSTKLLGSFSRLTFHPLQLI